MGVVIGSLEVFFGKGLLIVSEWRLKYFIYLIFLLPVAGLIIEFLYDRYGGRSRQGMGLIFDVNSGAQKTIPLRLIPIVIVSTWLTHLFGGSAGREGVAIQIGGTLAHWCGRYSLAKHIKQYKFEQIALITGMAAGFSGLFQTPIAAIFFAMEIFIVGRLDYRALLPATVGSFTAAFMSQSLGLEKFNFKLTAVPELNLSMAVRLIGIGILFGLAGFLFSWGLKSGKQLAAKLIINRYKRIFVGGLLLVFLMLVLHQGRYAGLGSNLIMAAFNEGTVYPYDFILKLALTVLTLSIGFQGGEVTPIFAIGSVFGAVLAPLFGIPVPLGAAIGYIGVFSSATNTFIAPIIMGCEVFGYQLLPYFFVALCLAYTCNFNVSIYGKQTSLFLKNELNR
ncbi:voltage-gated chloride channel protein [Vagococcus vulneris]|uniref:Voltage-gated chloride channel protein n=2 Tax=Vagococcus vulneris TaxID=1977869 RepID=A0A430A0N2_9ENTE|nr:chloride channel protein [Vagococcus vulneris]RST99879.1 voltage-gated chloride channel protein [Vagococcus vulneris]